MTHPITITQAELKEYSELEREVKVKQQHWEEKKESLLLLLRGGAEVEDGRFDARLITRVGRSVRWKFEFISRVGEAIANAVKREYKTHVWYDLQVMEHAVPPLWRGHEGEAGSEN
jgi:hypothetical protein